ncbi:MgtC/SapB family protein [Sedimenticola selenatireducens]|uniref:Protein MgtC n=1 Tax=Sedimenticola selenatireducens TaxID=191960 RepID=A0A2N6D153_9GAMM|nr:MgtC/SapB family protein [Sedimenticola selenatireducens]PLX63414.1 MAG: magnesium transporter MgtC [Sedimenticola selenatireducens]
MSDLDTTGLIIIGHLVGAMVVGGAIGLERSFHARPAGFRTHVLVCMASSTLMLVTYFQWKWLPQTLVDTVRADPARMAQGIMTGIGFLGAGVIFKEGLSVRGLTTAASIWITAAIGILIGIGFYFPAVVATLLTLGTLSVFRWIETKLPSQFYAHYNIRFDRNTALPESEIRRVLQEHGFTVANMSYRVGDNTTSFEYRMIIRTTNSANMATLAESLRMQNNVCSFKISPTGD